MSDAAPPPATGRKADLLRSLFTVDVMLRLAAVVLAGLIVVRALFAGADGFWSIVLVLAAVTVQWGAIRLYGTLRSVLAQGQPAGLTKSRLRSFLASRSRSRLAAVLALLILVVQAGITGYVGVWTILTAVALAAIAALLSPNLRLLALLGGTSVVFAAATVLVSEMFQGSSQARAVAVSVAAVVLPVLVSDKLVQVVRQPALTAAHHVALVVLTLTLGFLGWTRADWMPGVLQGCYTLPTSTGITVLRADAGRCFGLLDTADAGVFAAPAFGRNPVTTTLEHQLLTSNQPLRDGDLTVVWLGALSCEPLPADPTQCADGRDYPAERDQLRALMLAQTQIAASGRHRLHVVIADATQDVAHADDVAQMIVAHRAALGSRVVVVGGGDSRDTTQRAINRLLDAGIPFIAPNLLADLGAPDRPFVDRPGYLQLAPANFAYAEDTVQRLGAKFPNGFRLDIYQHIDATDQYTTSLVNDLLEAVKSAHGATARHLSSLDGIDDSVCKANTAGGPPTVLFFADRWTRFADFARRVNDVCGQSRPRLVIADGSVSRFMANDQLRAVSNADWSVDYYVGGPSCFNLTTDAFTTLSKQLYASRQLLNINTNESFVCADRAADVQGRELLHACPLDSAVKRTSEPCRPNDLGAFLIPAWDAVTLADALLPDRPPIDKDYLTSLNTAAAVTLATGAQATVHAGRLTAPTVPILLWHVDPMLDASRIWELPSPDLLQHRDLPPSTTTHPST